MRRPRIALVGALVAAILAACGADAGPRRADGTSAAPGTTTSTPADPETTGLIPVELTALPATGLALLMNEEVVLVELDGRELGRGPVNGWYTNNNDRGVDVVPAEGGVVLQAGPDLLDPVPGCTAVNGGGGVRVAACDKEIRRIAMDGTQAVLSGPVFEIGHWAYGLPSPDGKWVLGQWSAECEVPVAYLIEVATGARRTIANAATSHAIGWRPDAKALIAMPDGSCGEGADPPGTFVLDPTTGALDLVRSEPKGLRFFNRAASVHNRLELVVSQAIAEAGLETCCGEPSHGGRDADTGVVLDGHEIAIRAQPLDQPIDGRYEAGVFVACGGARYSFNTFVDRVPGDVLERAKDTLLPYLYCTLG